MIFGLSTAAYTLVHVVFSLVGIGSGFIVLFGMFSGKRLDRWTAVFLISTVLTSVTGFGFPIERLLPAHILGAISLVALAVAIAARYAGHLAGAWRSIYVVTAALALYLNCFVLVAQAFMKIPALKALAPTQSEPPFAIAQLVVLVIFVWLCVRALKRFRTEPMVAAKAA